MYMYEEFTSADPDQNVLRVGNNSWRIDTSGGTVSAAAGEPHALGVVQLAVTNGRCSIFQTLTGICTTGSYMTMQARVKVPVLATNTQAFRYGIGLGDSSTATLSTDGIYFLHDQTSGNWLTKTRSNNVETSTTTTYPVTAGAWVVLKWEVNLAATEVKFYAGPNGNNLTLVATHTTNIPQGSARSMGPLLKMVKTAGNSNRTGLCDYYLLRAQFNSGR